MILKMKRGTPLGSRIAEVHNGSSLFTGDAGQGESNIRRWIIENDWLEAIVALPLNMFYNTPIATYIWVLTNRKPERRRGKVQLIDATRWFKPLRKNLGKKNCELSEDDTKRICDLFLSFEETEESKILPNSALGYWKVVVERPLRLAVDLRSERRDQFCQGRSKSRPRWRRKSRPPSRWGGVAEGGLRTPGRLRGAGPSCCGQDDSSRRSAPGCGRDGSADRAGRRSAVRSRRSPSIR